MGAATAAVVAEGALKPDSGVSAAAVDAALLKIAATFQVSDELAEDAPYLVSAIQTEVLRSVAVKENAEIVAALSGASGIVTSTGPAADAIDVVAAAIGVAEAVNGATPEVVLMSPTDVATVRQAKASTGGSYHVDPLAAAPQTLHGVRLVSTAAVSPGTVLLASSGAAAFYVRGGVRVEAGFNGDDWARNLMTVRVEERILPAVVRPGLVTRVTLT